MSARWRPVVGSSKRKSRFPSVAGRSRKLASFRRCASPPEGGGGVCPERQVAEADVDQEPQPPDQALLIGEERDRVLHRQVEHLGDGPGGLALAGVLAVV